ncbi:MAG: LysR family transcriptional regulator [Paracoccaceae bacterium]
MPARAFNPLQHFAALRAFEAAARLGSFRAAAEELSVTDSAISRLIRQLEEASGVSLFDRLHRQVRITGPGRAFADEVKAALARLRAAGEALSPNLADRPLTIAAPATFLLRWLIPRQAKLQAALGNVAVHLETWSDAPDLANHNIMMFVSVGRQSHIETSRYVHLMPERFGLVVSPQRLSPNEDTLVSVAQLPRLVPRTRPLIWQHWIAEGGMDVPHNGVREYERMHFTMDAAEAGIGAAIAPIDIMMDAIEAGRLVMPFGAITRKGTYRIYVPPRFQSLEQVAIATRWFREVCRPVRDALKPDSTTRKP